MRSLKKTWFLFTLVLAVSAFPSVVCAEENKPAKILFRETGIYSDAGVYRYYETGLFQNKTGVFFCPEDGQFRYVKDGIFSSETGVASRPADGSWVYVKNGLFQPATGVSKRLTDRKLVYVKDGVFEKATGLFPRLGKEQWINIKNGVISKKTGLIEVPDTGEWILMRKGRQVTNPKKFFVTEEAEAPEQGELLCEAYARCLYDKIITDPDLPKREKLLKCFYYVESPKHYSYLMNRIPYYSEEDWPIVNTLDMIRDGGSTCFGYNALFAYLARLCGYEEVYFCCTKMHGWAEIDGRVFDLVFLEPPHNQMVFETTYEEADAMGLGHYYTDLLRRSKVPEF